MKKLERSALVSFSDQQMFDLVNDVESYPEFINGCKRTKILAQGEGWMEAELDLQKAGFSQTIATSNTVAPPASIILKLKSGPFKHFEGRWYFDSIKADACKVTFTLEYEFKNKLLGMAVGKIFEQIASEQVDAICNRAKQIYD